MTSTRPVPLATSAVHGSTTLASEARPDDDLQPPPRVWRNIIGYHNAAYCETDSHAPALDQSSPPPYERQESPQVSSRSHDATNHSPKQDSLEERHILPSYSCTVRAEGLMSLKVELVGPFSKSPFDQWIDVYVILQGTLFQIYRPKYGGFLSKSESIQEGPGRLIRSYTLQNAELGTASDLPKLEWIPRSAITGMLSAAKLEQLVQTEPHLFQPLKQYIIRLRLENEQVLLKHRTQERREYWMLKLCAAIDISPALEVRSEPNYQTLPRRQRPRRVRPGNSRVSAHCADAQTPDNAFNRAESTPAAQRNNRQAGTQVLSVVVEGSDADLSNTLVSDPERDDLDPDFMLDFQRSERSIDNLIGSSSGTPPDGHATNQSLNNSVNPKVIAINPLRSAKWAPRIQIDPIQEARYRRRCLPILLANSRRANDMIVFKGKKWKIDWDAETLVVWPEDPPDYDNLIEGLAVDDRDSLPSVRPNLHSRLRTLTTSRTLTIQPSSRFESIHGNKNQRLGNASLRKQKSAGTIDESNSKWKVFSTWAGRVRRISKFHHTSLDHECSRTSTLQEEEQSSIERRKSFTSSGGTVLERFGSSRV